MPGDKGMSDRLNGAGYRKTVLGNGLRVVTERVPHLESVSIGIWVTNGSRDERPEENGISHFIEHLLFKGTERRTAYQIAREIDSVGGVLNAFTEREHTCFFAKVMDEDLPLAVDLLSDIFLHPVFDRDEVERERAVILEEIKMVEDTPDDYVHDLFSKTCWGGHPLGFPIQGTADTIRSLTRDQLHRYFTEHYRPSSVILSAAGRLEHMELVNAVETTLGRIPERGVARQREKPELKAAISIFPKDLEQVHLCLGTKGLPYNHASRSVLYALNTMLGGGMSSRLFQEIREARGLAYSVQSGLEPYSDTGMVIVYAGTREYAFREAIGLTVREFERFRSEPLQEGILDTAKRHLRGSLILSLESSDSLMMRLARNEIYFGTYFPMEQILQNIASVSEEDVRRLAGELFDPRGFCLTLLGPVEGQPLDDLLFGIQGRKGA
jgi:predicted Zn-dependent peptidase